MDDAEERTEKVGSELEQSEKCEALEGEVARENQRMSMRNLCLEFL